MLKISSAREAFTSRASFCAAVGAQDHISDAGPDKSQTKRFVEFHTSSTAVSNGFARCIKWLSR
jgi:hypothetical protein